MTARYPILRDLATRGFDMGRECRDALSEIDTLRDRVRQLTTLNGRLERDFAAMNPHRVMVSHDAEGCHGEIREVTGRIANGRAVCNATWRDTEANGWLWYCSLPHGHEGGHRCIGASW
jgi:hypothetical protein